MSTPTSNTSATSSLNIGLIVGGVVLATIIIAIVIYVIKSRRNAGGAAPSMPSPTGTNAGMPSPINTNVNSTRLSNGNGRPQ